MKKYLGRISLLLSLVWVLGLFARAEEQSGHMNTVEQVPIDQMLANVEALAASLEKEGAQLLATFKDQSQPSKTRLRCAFALGRLKYLPAIQELIAQIDLHDEEQITTESAIEVMYPCVRALAEYGTAIIPAAVNAYMEEENGDRKRMLVIAITLTRKKDMAVTYAKGLTVGSVDDRASKQAQALMDALR